MKSLRNKTTSVFRIFLSSTAIDLKEHRQKVSDAILRLGDLPVAMETFGAMPTEPVEVCQDKARSCDALVVMVAHRYGWVPEKDEGGDSHKSITWLEVEAALNAGKPVFAFLVDQKYGWAQTKEQDLLVNAKSKKEEAKVIKKIRALRDFRSFLDSEAGLTRETFTTPDDLATKIATSLANWARKRISEPGRIVTKRTWVFRQVHPLQPAPHFRGRQNLLKDLQKWWEDPVHPDRVRSLVAIGGAGKTAVVERFLDNIQQDRLRGSVLIWSFYEDPNTDAFLREACVVFVGEEGEGAGGRLERLQRAISGSEPHLLILDGLERVQSLGKAGRTRGDLEDHQLKNLLRSIGGGLGRTRALVTSRFKLTDLEQWEGAGYRTHELDELDKDAAVSVLKAWKVNGEDKELEALAESVGRHALSVSVLGSYLHHFYDGDPKGTEQLKLEEIGEDDPLAAKLERILAGYARDLPDAERDLLIRLSVFPTGVSVEVLCYVIDEGGKIAGALIGGDQAKILQLANRLRKLGLVFTYKLGDAVTYTAHPFLRDYFRNLLGVPPEQIHEAVRKRLAAGLDTRPENKPREPEVLDRYEALIEHSIMSGRVQEAYDLYYYAIGGSGGRHHLYHFLGDYGRMMRILAQFAKGGEPKHVAPQLSPRDRSFLINDWGMAAMEVGDLALAESCFDVANELDRKVKDSNNLSQGLQNSAMIALHRASYPLAGKLLIESLDYAEPSNTYVLVASQARLAWTYHALGRIPEAKSQFSKATKVYDRPLESISGLFEAEHLSALGARKSARELAEANLLTCDRNDWVKAEACCHIILGSLHLADSPAKARSHLKKIRDWTARTGHMECILQAHILAAEIAHCSGDLPGALAEANAGLNLAEGCGFGRFAIDLLLLLAKTQLAIPEIRAALGNAREALDRSQHPDCQYAWGETDALHVCGICHRALNEPELARKRLEAAVKVRKRIQHPGLHETQKLLQELKSGS